MYLRRIVERDKMLRKLEAQGFTEARDGRPLNKLHYQDLCTEYRRLPELKEVSS